MALAGLPEDLALQLREARPHKAPDRARRRREAGQGGQEPTAEALVEARIAACDLLLRALRGASGALSAAARELKRVAASSRADPDFQEALQTGGPPVALLGAVILESCASWGAVLARLSDSMAGQPAELLQEAKRAIRADTAQSLAEMSKLEKQEAACADAVREASALKEKLASELGGLTQDRQNFENGNGLAAWLRKPSRTRIQETANHQRAVVEELAARMDREMAARQARKHGGEAFDETLRQVDARSCGHVRAALDRCSSAWGDAADCFRDTAERLRGQPPSAGGGLAKAEKEAASEHRPGFLERFINRCPQQPVVDLSKAAAGVGPLDESDEDDEPSRMAPDILPPQAAPTRCPPPRRRQQDSEPTPMAPRASGRTTTPDDEDGLREGPVRVVCFGPEGARLGFEILWDGQFPSVLKVTPGGEAERAGVTPGHLLKEVNGTVTCGRSREELMPLLGLRPLRLLLG